LDGEGIGNSLGVEGEDPDSSLDLHPSLLWVFYGVFLELVLDLLIDPIHTQHRHLMVRRGLLRCLNSKLLPDVVSRVSTPMNEEVGSMLTNVSNGTFSLLPSFVALHRFIC